MNDTASQILDAAESMIREGGYYGFSFRQIADQLSIKSASVHYHYPTKEALGTAVAERYTDRFLKALEDPLEGNAIERYTNLFKQALAADGRACLCGILAGEAGKLPESVREVLRAFSEKNIAWLTAAYQAARPGWDAAKCQEVALALFSVLEGGMTFAALHGRPEHLDVVAQSFINLTGS